METTVHTEQGTHHFRRQRLLQIGLIYPSIPPLCSLHPAPRIYKSSQWSESKSFSLSVPSTLLSIFIFSCDLFSFPKTTFTQPLCSIRPTLTPCAHTSSTHITNSFPILNATSLPQTALQYRRHLSIMIKALWNM